MKANKFLMLFKFLIPLLILVESPILTAQSFINTYDAYLYGLPDKKKFQQVKQTEKTETNDGSEKDIIPSKTPQPQLKKGSLNESENSHKLRFIIIPSYMTVEGEQISNGSTGIMNSSLYPSFKLDYTFRTSNWNTNLLIGRKTVTFENSSDRTIISPTHTLYRFDAILAHNFRSFSFGIGAGVEDKFFYKIINSSFADADISIDKKFYLYTDYQFLKFPKNKGSINFKIGINPKEKTDVYDIQTGYFYSTSLKYDYELSPHKSVGLEFYFKAEDYNTQQLHLKSTEIGIGVSFTLDWGVQR